MISHQRRVGKKLNYEQRYFSFSLSVILVTNWKKKICVARSTLAGCDKCVRRFNVKRTKGRRFLENLKVCGWIILQWINVS